jgi:hypothetical protein
MDLSLPAVGRMVSPWKRNTERRDQEVKSILRNAFRTDAGWRIETSTTDAFAKKV